MIHQDLWPRRMVANFFASPCSIDVLLSSTRRARPQSLCPPPEESHVPVCVFPIWPRGSGCHICVFIVGVGWHCKSKLQSIKPNITRKYHNFSRSDFDHSLYQPLHHPRLGNSNRKSYM